MVKRQDASTGQIVDDGTAPLPAGNSNRSLHTKIYSPFKVYFEGEVDSVSAVNASGPFDVLPQHHNFICLLNPCDLIVRTGGTEKKVRIARGIMHVRKNSVTVFLDV